MEINHSFKTEEGYVTFSGKLSQEEADYVIQTGLNFLMAQGALPFHSLENEEDEMDVHPGTETEN